MKKVIFVMLIVAFSTNQSLFSQETFKVDLSNRSPDVETLVRGYEGTKVIPFLAKDIKGVEQSTMSTEGKIMLLWFWHKECVNCISQIPALNRLSDKYADEVSIISFANEGKEDLAEISKTHDIRFPIIPNSETLAEGPYGGDLGYPKMFIADAKGVIAWAIPEIQMRGDFVADTYYEALINALLNNGR